ncbi:MAG: hypothetical protein RLZZ385_1364 [Pseudomonadota bacterium]|jgi:negative regulator of sigma E activity
MSEAVKESLSALLDNEATELDVQRILKAVEQDPALAKHWQRYCLTQSLLHDPSVTRVPAGFAERVAAAVAAEKIPAQSALAGWRQNLLKTALAASVAALVFAGLQTALTDGEGAAEFSAQQALAPAPSSTESTTAGPADVLVAHAPLQTVDPLARQRLEDYINSVSIAPEEPPQLQQLQDSPLFRLVNETLEQDSQSGNN